MKALCRKLHLLVVALLFVVLATPCYAMSMPVTKPVDSMEDFFGGVRPEGHPWVSDVKDSAKYQRGRSLPSQPSDPQL